MRHATRRHPRAFTLIELLTVIAIVGILAAIIIPTVGTVREKAQRAVDSNNLREIVKAAQLYAADNQDRLPDPANIPAATLTATSRALLWPGILAKTKNLSDPTFYFAKHDPAFDGNYPAFIIDPGGARNTLHPTFVDGRSPSWEFVGGVKMTDAPTTPLVYTRGLQSTGQWSATSGVYQDTGGFIAFLGGNIAFYPNTNELFTSNNAAGTSATKPTDILEAIPYNATAPATSARIYGIPPAGGAGGMIGTPAGVPAIRGP